MTGVPLMYLKFNKDNPKIETITRLPSVMANLVDRSCGCCLLLEARLLLAAPGLSMVALVLLLSCWNDVCVCVCGRDDDCERHKPCWIGTPIRLAPNPWIIWTLFWNCDQVARSCLVSSNTCLNTCHKDIILYKVLSVSHKCYWSRFIQVLGLCYYGSYGW